MNYEQVLIYDTIGTFLGYGIKKVNLPKLHSVNLYTEDEAVELGKQLLRLNTDVELRAHWPDARDPDVERLLNDASFRPLAMIWADVVDDEASEYRYEIEPDPETGELGRLDMEGSRIVYKRMQIPEHPSDVTQRVKAACEHVARQRYAHA